MSFKEKLQYCTRCLMPETQEGVNFDELGICTACQSSEDKMHIDWLKREKILKKILDKAKFKGYFVNNIDINIITQTPKIKNLKNKMIENIAKLCDISRDRINIKGKTTEKLGVIGKEKAIACEVIASVVKYD